MRSILTSLFVLGFFSCLCAQYPNSPISGWKMQEDNGHVQFAPAMLFGAPNFHYDVYPPQRAVGDALGDWLSGLAERDVRAAGYTVIPGQTQGRDVQSFRILSMGVKDAAGKTWLLNYMAYWRPDHSVRYGRIVEVPDVAVSKNNMNTAVQHFIKMSKQEGGLASSGGASGSGGSGATGGVGSRGSSGGAGGRTTVASGTETPVTAPGQGVKPSEIKGVVLHTEYGVGVGGMMIINYNPYLLLNDGTVYSHPYVCAYDLDVAKSREVEPKKWGTWKLEDAKTLVVTMNSDHKPERWEGTGHWFWASPAKKGEKLDGTWSTIGGGGNTAIGGGSIVVSSNMLTFNNQGQFTTLSTGGGTYSGSTGTVTAYSNKDAAGTYTFDGYSLELKYNNGTVLRKNFCSYDETREVWVFGTRPYTPDDKTEKKYKKK
jgi:hypothetical protein